MKVMEREPRVFIRQRCIFLDMKLLSTMCRINIMGEISGIDPTFGMPIDSY